MSLSGLGCPSCWHLWLKSCSGFQETVAFVFKRPSNEEVKAGPRGTAED